MGHFLFRSITAEMRREMVDQMLLYTLEPGMMVFKQGDPSKNFFVLMTGQLNVYVNGTKHA
jgi:CRP-like cAMP-binding protein